MSLFGTSGIRGVYGEAITPQLALSLGRSTGHRYKSVIVGHDHRASSPLLAAAFNAGALSADASVYFTGLVPTPTLAFGAKAFELHTGVEITASHNPPEYNGFKFWNSDGCGFSSDQEKHIEVGLNDAGSATGRLQPVDAIPPHLDGMLHLLPKSLGLKIVVNANHAAASVIAPQLFEWLDCEVVPLFCEPKPDYRPQKSSYPWLGDWASIADIPATLATIKETNADLGVIFDGDADRMLLCLPSGPVSSDVLMTYLASLADGQVVSVVDASLGLRQAVSDLHLVPVGDVHVSRAVKEREAAFGGEACSGTFVWPELHFCPDGIFSAAKVAALAAKIDLEEELQKIPKYPLVRERFSCPDEKKHHMMEKLKRLLKNQKLSTVDGIRVDLPDGWFLLRPSGTEPVIRLTAEALDSASLTEVLRTARNYLEQVMK